VAAITDLTDARESLEYWERRARGLPWLALRRRREARTMAARWRTRVAEAERVAYGRGLAGALFQLVCEQRLPSVAVHRGRTMVRRTLQVAAAAAVTMVAGFAAVVVLIVHALV
jgi:hypothetical protein